MPEEPTARQEANGCISSVVRLIAAPCSLGLLLTVGRPYLEEVTMGGISLILFILLFAIGLLDGALRNSAYRSEGSKKHPSLVSYAIIFSLFQCVIAIIVGITILFLACASGNTGW